MKILFILGFPNPFAGAAWTRVSFFAEKWLAQGQSVNILGTFTRETLNKRGVTKSGVFNLIPNVNVNHPVFFSLNNLFSFFVSTFFLIIRRPSVAVISVPGSGIEIGAITACKVVGCKYIIDYRDEWEDYSIGLAKSKSGKSFYKLVKQITRWIYYKSQIIVTVTPNCKVALEQRGIVNIKVMPNGADIAIFKPLQRIENTQFRLFYSGGIGLYYRLDVVLKALKQFVDTGAKDAMFVIAGPGDVNALLRMANQLGITKNVEYMGVITEKTKLANLIANVDVGLIPYDDNLLWKNALPAKFFEYCACGLPVVATVYADSLLGRLIRENAIGIISPPLNDVKLAEAFFDMYSNKSLRESAGEKARTLITEKFDRNKIAEEYLRLIKEN
jgi:colanic acid biosynthesis glycosyl transferase WcaI